MTPHVVNLGRLIAGRRLTRRIISISPTTCATKTVFLHQAEQNSSRLKKTIVRRSGFDVSAVFNSTFDGTLIGMIFKQTSGTCIVQVSNTYTIPIPIP